LHVVCVKQFFASVYDAVVVLTLLDFEDSIDFVVADVVADVVVVVVVVPL
jgi:hypothetical protein